MSSFLSKLFGKKDQPNKKSLQSSKHILKEELSPELFGRLKSLVPLNGLTSVGFNKAMAIATIKQISPDWLIFSEGDNDLNTFYLLEGRVELFADHSKPRKVIAGEGSGLYPLSNLKPRSFNAKTIVRSIIVEFPTEELERIMHWDQVADSYEVHEAHDEGKMSWIFYMTKSPAIAQLPNANIQALFTAFKSINVASGDRIVTQDEIGDYYYVIAEGSCEITREYSDGRVEVLGNIKAGDTFGEEALLSDAPRNATVTMTSDGVLMRLSKEDFTHLLKDVVVKLVRYSEISLEDFVVLDVRSQAEFKLNAIKGSIHVPLFNIRKESQNLDKEKSYLVYCNNGASSASAAYLMAERGFNVSVLENGLADISL